MMGIILRDYQQDLVDQIRASFKSKKRRVLAVSPTASGKTVVFTYIVSAAAALGNSVTIVAHRQEIVYQISRALDSFGVQHGLIMPGHTHTDDKIQVAMIQTLGKRLNRMDVPSFLVFDECHHAVSSTWANVINTWKNIKILGVTATPERLDGRGLGDVFDAMVLGPTVRSLIASGHLAGFDYFAPPVLADLSEVKTEMGDYNIKALAAAMDRNTITGDAVEHYRSHLDGRPALAFCVTINHAENVAEQFRAAGYRAASVDGKMKRDLRADRIAALADGRLNVLTSCDVISEGTDIPICAGAILLRPTKSLAMNLQQIGRTLRQKPDGSRAVILDHVGNIERFGMPDAPRAWSLDGRAKRTSSGIRQCDLCYQVFPSGCQVECENDACPLRPQETDEEGGGKGPPEVVEGQLVAREDPFAWTGGIDLALARGAEWRALLARAGGDMVKLRQIAKCRNYKRGWIKHVMQDHAAKTAGVAP